MSCVSNDYSCSEVPTYSDILDQVRKKTVQEGKAGINHVAENQASEVPAYSNILDQIRKKTVQKGEADISDVPGHQADEAPDDDMRSAIDSSGCNALLGDSSPSYSVNHRKYIPSPLNSPATARRLSQKWGNQISAKARGSPKLLSKAACKIQKMSPKNNSKSHDINNKHFPSQHESQRGMNDKAFHTQPKQDSFETIDRCREQTLPSMGHSRLPTEPVISPALDRTHSLHQHPSSPTAFIQPKSDTNRPSSAGPQEKVSFFNSIVSSWFPSFIGGGKGDTSSKEFSGLSSKQKMNFLKKNCFANNSPDYNLDMEMHRFGDTGRIANRYQEDRWDVWTTMGEDVNNYEEIIFDDEEEDEYEETEYDYEVEEDELDGRHIETHNVDVASEHRAGCGARIVHCCEKHHHICPAMVEIKRQAQLDETQICHEKSSKGNKHTSRICHEGSENNCAVAPNRRIDNRPGQPLPCLASSNSSSSDEFLELPFNDLSVSSGIYGAARNACYTNANITNMPSSSMNRKR